VTAHSVTEVTSAARPCELPLLMTHVPGLDGIRGLAIALVLFSHSVIYDEFTAFRSAGLAAGSAGVTLFFVLSGFLITTLVMQEEDRTGAISLGRFYLRRSFRLFPALWLYLLVVFVIWACDALPHHPWYSFVTSLLYIRNIVGRGHETAHLWSLSIEEQFYIVWPIVFLATPSRNGVRLTIAICGILLVSLWRTYAANTMIVPVGTLYMRTDFRIDAPLFGCALALVRRLRPRPAAWLTSTRLGSNLLAVISLGGLAIFLLFGVGHRVMPGIDSTMVCLLGIIMVMSQIGTQGICARCLTWRPLVWLGQISYGVYLWQQLFLGPPISGLERFRSFPLGLFTTIVVALLSFHLIERPFNRFKNHRFRTRTATDQRRTTAAVGSSLGAGLGTALASGTSAALSAGASSEPSRT
jgi:peptidoglycan/LPS O-acetylase OafA/YrhL